jgi:phage gp36-like protein
MAQYCDETDIGNGNHMSNAELAILTGDPTGTTIDTDRVDTACIKASQYIDSMLGKRYVVPFPGVGPLSLDIINTSAVDLAIYNLYEDHRRETEVPSATVWRRITTIAELKRIENGQRILSANDLPLVQTTGFPNVTSVVPTGKNFDNDDYDQYYSGN